MMFHVVQDVTVWLTHINFLTDLAQSLPFDLTDHQIVIAQQIPQTDLMGDMQKAFNNFVKTGQAWAFLIGLVLGYMLKAFTTFG